MILVSKNSLTLLFLITGLVLLLLPPSSPPLKFLTQVSYFILAPVIKVQREVEEEVEKSLILIENFQDNLRLITRLRKLEEENAVLRKEVESLKSLIGRLEKDLDFFFQSEAKYLVSKIIFYDPSGNDRFFIIRGGMDRGITKGSLVVSRGKVLGVVEEVFLSTSKVITLFNEKCSLPAKVKLLDKVYIYKGDFPEGKLLYVDIEDAVPLGGEVYYKDLTLKIPEFPIGTITRVSYQNNPFFKDVRVKPLISPREVEFVVVFLEE
ncbi:rod shape-determining protein MreC [Aquifex sp.]